MAILIDKPLWWFRGERWSHLVSDLSYDELHAFVDQLGVPRRAFQGDHYDIPERYWQACVDLGATPTDSRSLVKRLRAAGLRKPPKNRRATSDDPIASAPADPKAAKEPTVPFKPMKAVAGALPVGDQWVYELKWDGMRAVVQAGPEGVEAWSSHGSAIGHRFPELGPLGHEFASTDVVLDGEIVALGEDGLPSFGRLQGRMHLDRPLDIQRRMVEIPVVFVVFDLLRFDNTKTITLPYQQRRQLLEAAVEPGESWQLSTVHTSGGADLLAVVRDAGMEGLVAKRRDSVYAPGTRSQDWVKIKPRQRQEFVVAGYTSGPGGHDRDIGSVLVGYYDEAGLRFSGRVGSGLNATEVEALLDLFEPTDDSAFVDPVPPAPGRTTFFVAPREVVEVAFGEWTADNNLRHPVYLGRRADVDPRTVRREPNPTAAPE